MNVKDLLGKYSLSKVSVDLGVASVEFTSSGSGVDANKAAAWDLYVELSTRITTQPLPAGVGDEQPALDSVYSLFNTTRSILRDRGSSCYKFSQVAFLVLNQIVRPFTAKWHKASLAGAFGVPERCLEFRNDLSELQKDLLQCGKLLAEIAGVEDLSSQVPEEG